MANVIRVEFYESICKLTRGLSRPHTYFIHVHTHKGGPVVSIENGVPVMELPDAVFEDSDWISLASLGTSEEPAY